MSRLASKCSTRRFIRRTCGSRRSHRHSIPIGAVRIRLCAVLHCLRDRLTVHERLSLVTSSLC